MNLISKLSKWYFSRNALPYWCVFIIDCLIVFFSIFGVFVLTHGPLDTFSEFPQVCGTILFYLLFYIIGFRIYRTYTGIIRYSSFVDLQRITYAGIFGFAMFWIVRNLFNLNEVFVPIAVRVVFFGTLVAMSLMWGVRVIVKTIYDTMYKRSNAKKAFIYGIKQGGTSIAKSIRNQDPAHYVLDGFITEHADMYDRMLMGVKVYPVDDKIVETMKRRGVQALFVSPLRSESLRENTELVNDLISEGIKIFMVPHEQEWDGKSDISHQRLREIEIEDLLPREKIEVDMASIGEQLRGKSILITGAAGSIGSEIVSQVAVYEPAELVLIDQAETPLHDMRLMMAERFPEIKAFTIVADISNRRRMKEIFASHKPQFVFHAAAYKHVPMMEDNPAESVVNNVEGTRVIADLAVKYGTDKFVMVSTDKAVNPTNVMGCSKRICEIYVQSLDKAIKDGTIHGKTQFVTTRFGNVLGSNGSVIPLFKEQIRRGGPVTVTHPEIIRYFMLIPEACKLVLEAGTMGHGGEIFVFDMGKPVKIVDLAKRMIMLSGVDIEIKFTGLRDGEKLYEEVLNDEEITVKTFHAKIKIAKVREYDYFAVNLVLEEMVETALKGDAIEVVRQMKALVPEYHPQHSPYQNLD